MKIKRTLFGNYVLKLDSVEFSHMAALIEHGYESLNKEGKKRGLLPCTICDRIASLLRREKERSL